MDIKSNIEAFFFKRLGLVPQPNIHSKGHQLFTKNIIIKESEKPKGNYKFWLKIKLKTHEIETDQIVKYRARDYLKEPDDVPWKIHKTREPVYEIFDLYGNHDYLIKMDYRQQIVWRKWSEVDRDLGIVIPIHVKPLDIKIAKISHLPTTLDFPDQITYEYQKISIVSKDDVSYAFCPQLNINDLVEIDIKYIEMVNNERVQKHEFKLF